jgi:putative ABC transport system permease protein
VTELLRFAARMAWRDSRASRRKLALFSSSIILGVAALAAIGSFAANLRRAVEEQTKTLINADLILSSSSPFTPEAEAWFKTLGGEQSRGIVFNTMLYFPRAESSHLVNLRSLSGHGSAYGQLETEPPAAAEEFRHAGGGVVIEESLLTQFGAKIGDEVRVGDFTTKVAGRLKKVTGEIAAISAIAPRVYISMDDLHRTGLLSDPSLAGYLVYFKFAPGTDIPEVVKRIRPQLDKFSLDYDSLEKRKRQLGRSLDNLYHFLNLVAFVALLLGGVGVGSATHAYVKQKLGAVAVLRCLGGSIAQTFAIYVIQAMALGLFGALLGGALGIAIQASLPRVLADFMPFTFQFRASWLAIARAMGIGFVISFLFALLPLLAVRRVSPLAALQAALKPARVWSDPWQWVAAACATAGTVGFALMQSRDWRVGTGFAGGLAAVFAILSAIAWLLIWLTRKFVPASLPFALRQGIANLHRPNNRTLLLLLSLGLGTFLIMSLYLVQRALLAQLTLSRDQANAVLFDIQPSQRQALTNLLNALHLPVLDETPIVSMRLSSIKGRSIESLLADKSRTIPRWALRREYQSSYSDHLHEGERIAAGHWVPRVAAETNIAPISLEQGIAKELKVGVGDELGFDVQGVPVTARVASLRVVEWRQMRPNFFIIFPRGVLEEAPALDVLVTHVGSSDESARMQREVVKAFPNVLTIDLTMVVQTVESLLGKISFVIQFMAAFTILTGLVVLISVLATGRYQRLQESVLLRTLGASRRQIFQILVVEYAALGVLAAITGLLLAIAAGWALAKFLFHTPFLVAAAPLLLALTIVSALTVFVGLLFSRGLVNYPPLVILRSEV